MGWPCHFGGAVEVLGAASTKYAKPRNCIVFYSPEPGQDMSQHPSTWVQGRVGVYGEIANFCIDAAQKKAMSNEIIALSNIATCIMEAYPDKIGPVRKRPAVRTRLNSLRGVAVYVIYGMPDVIDDIGVSVPEGQVVQNCKKFSFPDSLGLKPVSLCHTALLSATEPIKSKKKRSPPPP